MLQLCSITVTSPLPWESFTPTLTNTPTFTPTPGQPPQGPVTITYEYDPLYRLTAANYSTGDYYNYTYDSVGNRVTQTTQLAVTSYQYDVANRLIDVDGVPYIWDNNGNLLNDGVNTYAYDSANRLKTLSRQGNNVTYSYNGFGDRLQEITNGNTTSFMMDLNTRYTRALSDGTNIYHYGIGLISQTQGNGADYFLGDALGSVRQLADSSGEITYAKAYDPYGVVRQTVGNASTAYGYTGEYTSNDLMYLRARHYAPEMGRFFTRDPFAGYAFMPQTQNPYAYGLNNPILYTDPNGQNPLLLVPIIFAFAAGGGDLMYQLGRNNGNWDCVDWGEVALWAGGGAVAGLVVVTALPVILASPDSAVDLASLAFDAYTGDTVSFALDAMSLMVPGVTGLGALSRTDDAYRAVNRIDNFNDAAHTLRYADEVGLGMTRYQQDILIRNLDPDALIAVRSRPWAAHNWDGMFPMKTKDIISATKLRDFETGLDTGLRMTKNGDIVISDLDIAGYTIKGYPISTNDFMETFAKAFNQEYGHNAITHGHLVNGFDNPNVVAALFKEGGDRRISGLRDELVHLFDSNGYRGPMKYWEYYSEFVIKGTDPDNILKLR